MTLREYYKAFRNVYLLGAGSGFILPLVHVAFGSLSLTASCLYPPLGDLDGIAIALTLGFLLLTTYVVLGCLESSKAFQRHFALFVGLPLVVGIIGMFFLYTHFFRVVELTSIDTKVPVTIGYEKTPLGVELSRKTSSDADLIGKAQATEDKIQQLWTLNSLWIVRTSLWFCYTLTLCCWVAFFSKAAYRHVLESSPKQPEST